RKRLAFGVVEAGGLPADEAGHLAAAGIAAVQLDVVAVEGDVPLAGVAGDGAGDQVEVDPGGRVAGVDRGGARRDRRVVGAVHPAKARVARRGAAGAAVVAGEL